MEKCGVSGTGSIQRLACRAISAFAELLVYKPVADFHVLFPDAVLTTFIIVEAASVLTPASATKAHLQLGMRIWFNLINVKRFSVL